ncbi:DUF5958 family protein [Saccharothrix hoggarensis]|uniref:DUF5958 family protein n=1 Tax=Saccharothrix hoggarensis TaxID=913853 RepID=A0ABW3QMZ5_9PSEU
MALYIRASQQDRHTLYRAERPSTPLRLRHPPFTSEIGNSRRDLLLSPGVGSDDCAMMNGCREDFGEMHERGIILNELAQGLRPLSEGVGWFEGLAADDQVTTLRDVAEYCVQARATVEDGAESVRRSGIRPTHTPAVLITRGRLTEQLAKIVNLPADERVKAFRLLVALLGVADERRRARYCADGCGHAWHHLSPGRQIGSGTG